MSYILFIHSSVDGHLGCFHVLTTVNSASVNSEVHVSFWIMFFSGYMSRGGIAGPILVFSFLKNLRTVRHSGCTNYISANSVGGFPFLHASPVLIICRFLDDVHSDWCEMILLHSFDFQFSNN